MRATNAEVMVINGTINKDWIRQYGEDIHNVKVLRTLIHGSGLTLAILVYVLVTSFSYVLLRLIASCYENSSAPSSYSYSCRHSFRSILVLEDCCQLINFLNSKIY